MLETIKSMESTLQARGRRPSPEEMLLSVVMPVYNEIELLPDVFARLEAMASRLDCRCEFVLVDDGCRDGSGEAIRRQASKDSRFVYVGLSRNFGHQAALAAGLEWAKGDAVVMMDSDLQDPPELIPELIGRWREGYEVVYAQRRTRKGETWFKTTSSDLFYWMMGKLTEVEIPRGVGDFRLVDRNVLDVVLALKERNRFLRGLFSWVGFRQVGVLFDRDARRAGETKYPLHKMMKLMWSAVTGFSDLPLRLILNLGVVTSLSAFVMGMYWTVEKMHGATFVPGWTSLMVIVLFLGGVQLTVLGIIGQYLARSFDESRGRPMFIVAEASCRPRPHTLDSHP
jgi:dolichol-phosphate mannosyltransferase